MSITVITSQNYPIWALKSTASATGYEIIYKEKNIRYSIYKSKNTAN